MLPVYIIILNYKKWQDTLECLESVFNSCYENFSVVVVDNDSQNHSLDHLISWANKNTIFESQAGGSANPVVMESIEDFSQAELISFSRLTFVQNSHNAGFAGGVNFVLKALVDQDAYVWLLNPDMVVTKNSMAELVSFAGLQPRNCITGAMIKSYWGNRELAFCGGFRVNFYSATVRPVTTPTDSNQLDYISGGCLFTHTSTWKQLGLLPEQYFLYWEETDWCYWAKQREYQLLACPGSICYDKGSTAIGKSFMADYYYVRNGLMFISKFRKKNIPFVLFFVAVRFLKRAATGRWDRARGVFKGTMDFFKMKPYEIK